MLDFSPFRMATVTTTSVLLRGQRSDRFYDCLSRPSLWPSDVLDASRSSDFGPERSCTPRPKVVCARRGTDAAIRLCGPGDGLSFCLSLIMEEDARAAGRRRLTLTIPLRTAWFLWP